jgi:hypothetical protein
MNRIDHFTKKSLLLPPPLAALLLLAHDILSAAV